MQVYVAERYSSLKYSPMFELSCQKKPDSGVSWLFRRFSRYERCWLTIIHPSQAPCLIYRHGLPVKRHRQCGSIKVPSWSWSLTRPCLPTLLILEDSVVFSTEHESGSELLSVLNAVDPEHAMTNIQTRLSREHWHRRRQTVLLSHHHLWRSPWERSLFFFHLLTYFLLPLQKYLQARSSFFS